jgi:hypothetical protein
MSYYIFVLQRSEDSSKATGGYFDSVGGIRSLETEGNNRLGLVLIFKSVV